MPAAHAGRINLCGAFRLVLGGRDVAREMPRRQLRLLCAYLLLSRQRASTRDELVAAIWPERPPPGHQAALSALLSHLRHALGDDASLEGRTDLRLLLPGDTWVDTEAAERSVAEAEAALAAGRAREAWAPANLTLSIVSRGLLPGYERPWIDDVRRELDELALRALECIARVGLEVGGSELAGAERAARGITEREPYRESGYRFLMQVHEARGDIAEALRVYERLRVLLREELGTVPAGDLQAHHARLLALGSSAPTPAATPALPPLPAALDAAGPFVGRDALLETLHRLAQQTRSEGARLVMLGGEAGIGKTRLCAELARVLHEGGTYVLYGRSDEEATLPYQPFVELLARHAAHTSPDALRAQLGGRGGELARLLPDLRRVVPDIPQPLRGQPETQRYRLFEEMAALAASAAQPGSLLIVLDDLHWADRPTLLLFRHLARAGMRAPVLVLGTYRTTELVPSHPLAGLLADLTREELASRLVVEGLDELEVGQFISAWAGRQPSRQLTRALYAETDGNPFFLSQILRHVADRAPSLFEPGGGLSLEEVGVPEGVRETLDRRLARLGEEANRALREASVLGRDFYLDALTIVTGLDEEPLLGILQQGVEAGLVCELPEPPGRYSFSHALVRDALYDALGATRRARLHGKVAEVLETLHADDLEPHLAEIAHHFSRAPGPAALERAIEYSSRAGRRAMSVLAYEEAVDHYNRALGALRRARSEDDAARCRLLIDLGRAQNRAGASEVSKRTFHQAADLASQLGDAALLSRAALGYAGPWLELGTVDDVRLELLERALEAVGPADSVQRAGLLSRLALEVYYTGPERRERLSREAVEVARRLGDGVALARALLSRRVAIAGSPDVAERLAVTTELIELARLGGATETVLWGHVWRAADLIDEGDMPGAYAEFDAYAELARGLRQPAYLWQLPLFAAMRSLFEGRFDEIDALTAEGLEIGRRAHDPNAANYFGILGFMLRWSQGRLAEVEDAVRAYVERYPAVPAWRCGLTLLYAELGREEAARTKLEELASDRFAGLPVDINWLPAVTWLAMSCGLLGEREHAALLYELMEPHAARNVTTGHPIFCLGAVSHYLGVLAATSGRLDLARGHFEDALARNEAMGSPPLLAHTRYEYGRALLAAGGEEDRRRADELLAAALPEAQRLGMAALATRATAVRATGARPATSAA